MESPVRLDINVFVGGQLKLARLSANISLERLALAVGVAASDLETFESGEHRVSAEQLYKIARATCSPLDFFFPP